MEGGDQETDGELLAETEETPYECGARQKFPMLFDEPVSIQVILILITGILPHSQALVGTVPCEYLLVFALVFLCQS